MLDLSKFLAMRRSRRGKYGITPPGEPIIAPTPPQRMMEVPELVLPGRDPEAPNMPGLDLRDMSPVPPVWDQRTGREVRPETFPFPSMQDLITLTGDVAAKPMYGPPEVTQESPFERRIVRPDGSESYEWIAPGSAAEDLKMRELRRGLPPGVVIPAPRRERTPPWRRRPARPIPPSLLLHVNQPPLSNT